VVEVCPANHKNAEIISYIIRAAYREQAALLTMDEIRYPHYAGFETENRVREHG